MHATSRSVVAAARTHPAGVAAPSAVIVTAIILFTLVTSVIVPSIRPGLFGIGSAPAIPPSPDHPRHRVLPQPVPTGPPILPALTGSLGGSTSSTSGRSVPSPAGGGQPPVAPNPPTVSGFPPGTVPAPVVSRHLPAPSAAGCPACCGGPAPGSAVVTVVAGAGNAVHAVTQVVTSEAVIPAVTSGLAATTGPVVRAAGTVASGVTSTVTSVASATAATAVGTVGSVTAHVGQALTPAVTATVAGAGNALEATAQAATSGSVVPAVTSVAAPVKTVVSAVDAAAAPVTAVAAPVTAAVAPVTAAVTGTSTGQASRESAADVKGTVSAAGQPATTTATAARTDVTATATGTAAKAGTAAATATATGTAADAGTAAGTAAKAATGTATATGTGPATQAGGAATAAAGQPVQAASQVPAGTAVGQAPSGAATKVVDAADQVNHRRSAESSSEQAVPGAGTLPGVG
ncbi:MAG TPA: hypothetical protein VFV73_37550 [Streptosporangiaceae bacterium]|nr:hypothetical protein [Streptosporangiaceae bacterium]